MTKALKKKPKGVVIEELTVLVQRGREMLQRPTDDMFAMAELTVEKLEWIVAVLQTLPQMSRGIQVVSDFNRAGLMGRQAFYDTVQEEREHFNATVGAQVEVLDKAVDKWRKSNTRPLT